ncbi:MAG: TAXI family TRAP transporter solute-binding subunit [Alphaproteobacteria bacterium]|nr:TAXI family TRAP transporter solute-binding subunit [Alphaproteobacteria bacterium]
MNYRFKKYFTFILILFILFCSYSTLYAQNNPNKVVFIGTGPVVGVYFPAGGAICLVSNTKMIELGLRCAVESSEGSFENLQRLRDHSLDFSIVQSDWQNYAFTGTGPFEKLGAFKELRSIFSLYAEAITVVVRKDSNITKFTDLKNKRVNIGLPGTAQRALIESLFARFNWQISDMPNALEIDMNQQAQSLCNNKLDAFILPVSHPNGAIEEATRSCAAVLIDVQGPEIDQFVTSTPYLAKTTIPAGLYIGNTHNVNTFGLKATFVTTTAMSNDMVYELVKSIFEDFDRFKSMHPVFEVLTIDQMIKFGNTAPLHDGALRYYKEKGLL